MSNALGKFFAGISKLFQSIINFFYKEKNAFTLGAHLNIPDSRDIHISTVQAPVPIPLTYKTDLSMFTTLNQLDIGSCLWQARRMMRQYMYYKKTGKVINLSARSGYIPSKAIDGLGNVQGTTARAADSVLLNQGIAEDAVVPDDNTLPYDQYISFPVQSSAVAANMAEYKIGGYVSVSADFNSIKQAIFQNKVICFTLGVDENWFSGIIMKVLNLIGYHGLIGYGYDAEGIFGKNSWGIGWVAVLAKAMGFPAGDFYIKWTDYQNDIYDIIAYVDIPAPILDNAKSLNYHFDNVMKVGDDSPEVLQLQNRLDKAGYWPAGVAKSGYYGAVTCGAVLKYQLANKIDSEANLEALGGNEVGPRTLRMLNGEIGLDFLHAEIQVESQGNDYAVGDKNLADHAYGCLQIRQGVVDQVNGHLGMSYKSQDCLGNRDLSIKIWTIYWTIFTDMVTDKDKAFAWNGGPGWRGLYGKPGYEKYTSELDAYWGKIEAMLS